MPNDTITLALDGDVNLDDLAQAIPALRLLLGGLASGVAPGAEVEWVIEGLNAGSTLLTARGESSDVAAVETIASAYLTVGLALAAQSTIPYATNVQRQARRIVSLLDQRVTAIRFETIEADATVRYTPDAQAIQQLEPLKAFGAVEGVVQTLSNRKGLRFTLYDTLFDKPVSCYLGGEGQEGLMRDAWGRRAIVEGWVSRDPVSGRPISIREIAWVELVQDVPPGAYRAARGILPLRPGDASPSETIRRLRDA